MEKSELYNNVNTALNEYVTKWNSFNKAIASNQFNDEVLCEIDIIYDYVNKYNVDWEKETMESVLKRLAEDILIKFSFLNEMSINTLKNYFSYIWK